MTDAELLQHYIQCKRIIHGAQRSPGHHRLLKLGFIKEYPVSSKNLLITATAAGRTAMGCWPAEYVGTHAPLWPVPRPSPANPYSEQSVTRLPARPLTHMLSNLGTSLSQLNGM